MSPHFFLALIKTAVAYLGEVEYFWMLHEITETISHMTSERIFQKPQKIKQGELFS